MMWRKYGYGRAAAQLSVDIRAGRIHRDDALAMCHRIDGIFAERYAGVDIKEVLDRIGMTREQLNQVMDEFTNWSLMRRVEDRAGATPILI